MVKSFLVALMGTLMVVILLILPGLGRSAVALELPEELQNFLNQAASDLNFPYPASAEKSSEESSEDQGQTETLDQSWLANPTELMPKTPAPTQGMEAQKAALTQQHLN
jgi:hypothetical protein